MPDKKSKIVDINEKPMGDNSTPPKPSDRMICAYGLSTAPRQEIDLPASATIQEDFPIPLQVSLDGVGERSSVLHNMLQPTLFVSVIIGKPTAVIKAIIYCVKTNEQAPPNTRHLGTVFINGIAHHYLA